MKLTREEQIRPSEVFDEYLALSKADVPVFFPDARRFVRVACPGCGRERTAPAFQKHRFQYERCLLCGTLFVNPRPDLESLLRFYREAPSNLFFANQFYDVTEPLRIEPVYRPRARAVAAILADAGVPRPATVVDVGAGRGSFCAELKKLEAVDRVVALEPSPAHAAHCRAKGVDVVQQPVETAGSTIPGAASAATSFELIEHVFSPDQFLSACATILKPGGLLVLTTLNAEGFDLRILGERSRSISPPHHLNFLTPTGMALLLDRHGFALERLDTPGRLDVDLVCRYYEQSGETPEDPFVRTLLTADARLREELQDLLARRGLSSHLQAVARFQPRTPAGS